MNLIAQARHDFDNGTLVCRDTWGKVLAYAAQLEAENTRDNRVAKPDLSGVNRYVCDLRNAYGMRGDDQGAWVRLTDVQKALAKGTNHAS